MSNIKYILMASILLLLAGSCAITDMDRAADFRSYQTYTWGKPEEDVKNPLYKSDLISKNIRQTVEREFAQRGISIDKRNPDFVVSYRTYTEQKQQIRGGTYSGFGFPYFGRYYRFYPFGMWGYPYGWRTPVEHTYTEGTLIIDITDNKTNELIWRGTVRGNVDEVSGLQKQIQKGIKAIMKKYPVKPEEPLPVKEEKVIS